MRLWIKMTTLSLAMSAFVFASSGLTQAEDKAWWPIKVYDLGDMLPADFDTAAEFPPLVDYVPLDRASKKWHLCVLFPHMKDPSWLGMNAGVVNESKRLGVKMTLYQAGGYTELTKQISQFDDCMALGADAIVVAVVSEGGMTAKIQEAVDQGIVVVSFVNPTFHAAVDARVQTSYKLACRNLGAWLGQKYMGSEKTNMLSLPGAPGSGWAEACQEGVEAGIAGSPINLLEAKYGDTGKAVGLKLVEDALQTYDDIDLIFAVAVHAEVAVQAVDDAGLLDKINIHPWQLNPKMLEHLESGAVKASGSVLLVPQSRIAIDLAVRILDGKPFVKQVFVNPIVVEYEKFADFDPALTVAPAGWKPTYNVD